MKLELSDERLYEVRRTLEDEVKRTLEGLDQPWMANMPELQARAQNTVTVLTGVIAELDKP